MFGVTDFDLARYCNRSYDIGHPLVLSHKETDVLVHHRKHSDITVLSVRGTEFGNSWPFRWDREGFSNFRDIVRDLRFIPWQEPISGCWCHKGFGISAYRWFKRYFRDLPKARLYLITGHSLGAGVASHLARIMKLYGFNVCEVVLFGEPKGHYFKSEENYSRLSIRTRSYRNDKDWIKFAGIGSTTVPVTILYPEVTEAKTSHNIETYVNVLNPDKGLHTFYL